MDKKLLFANLIAKNLGKSVDEVFPLIEKPKDPRFGDLAFPCFTLAKDLRKNPAQIAQDLAATTQVAQDFEKFEAVGPYINAYLNPTKTAEELFELYSANSICNYTLNKKTYLIEWPSPNSNKPLHLGHVRNMLLGKALSILLEKTGNKVIKVNLNNDRGIAICKSMLIYKKFHADEEPQSRKSDYFVGDCYTEFETRVKDQPELEHEAQDLLRKWESSEAETIALWKKMNAWTFAGHEITYAKFDINHEKSYFESNIYKEGKDIVQEYEQKGVFTRDEKDNIICDLTKEGYDEKVLLRADGTSVYMTQDLALLKEKAKDFPDCDRYIFIVGNEQAYHFKVLFEIAKKLGYGDLDRFYHFAYGMISLPEGKMSSRKGNVIYADELIDEVELRSIEILKEKEISKNLPPEELERRAKIISHAAVAFYVLKYNPLAGFVFNPEESLSFEGETGPYVLYTYARIQSVLRKANAIKSFDIGHLHEKEVQLIKVLMEYTATIKQAAEQMQLSSIANYLIDLAQACNEFYHSCPIIAAETDDTKHMRLTLAKLSGEVIKDALSLLSIDVLEEM
ncbi:arginine--tRNA ligase [Candidatus Woesearchaeota archaeon]|nr:arginine--tRNA ligase [Candidatus Woesearchaeota archaeon]